MEFPKSLRKSKELLAELEAHVCHLETGDVTTLHVEPAPDEYRGDLDCLNILDEVDLAPFEEGNDGQPDRYYVIKDGKKVAILKRYYGNNGKGKLASETIEALPGVSIIWENEED